MTTSLSSLDKLMASFSLWAMEAINGKIQEPKAY